MFGSNTIEIAIGLILVFTVVSTICTAIREGIEAKLKTRAAYLEQGIRQLLADKDGTGLASAIYNHPLISGLYNGDYTVGKSLPRPDLMASGNNLPSYIPSKNFARALMDIAANGKDIKVNTSESTPVFSLDVMRANIEGLGNLQVQRVLLIAIDLAQGDINTAQQNIENWFDSSMDRISGWYKRSTQWVVFWIGLAISIALNVNSITIIDYLSRNETARKVLLETASVTSKDTSTVSMSYDTAMKKLDDLKLPIGWYYSDFSSDNFDRINGWNMTTLGIKSILGWLITALAATLGAPFWFDMLNKFMIIRSTVKPNEKSEEEGPKDGSSKTPNIIINPPVVQAVAAPTEKENDDLIDCCGIPFDDDTPDEDLPVSKGGVEL